MRRSCLVAVGAVVVSAILPLQSFAQSPSLSTMSATSSNVPESTVISSSAASAPDATFEQQRNYRSLSNRPGFAVGVKAGTLGIGIQAAAQVANRVNVRGGFNVFNYSNSFTESGTNYDASLNLRSVEANLDLLIGGGFRFSPGILLYNNNNLSANLSAPAGQQFSIGGVTYVNDTPPISGTGSISFNKFSPMLAIGFGQMVPRSGRHFSVQFDMGVVFEDAPTVGLTYGGNACVLAPNGAKVGCAPINLQPSIVANITSEQTKVSDALKILKYYPVMSLGFGWRF
jgi:hypothetical protein